MLINALQAFDSFIKILFLPAVILLMFGIYNWQQGVRLHMEDKRRVGKMLTMFGVIMLVMLQIIHWVLGMQYGLDA